MKAEPQDIQAFIDTHSHWSIDDGKLHRSLKFGNFPQAFAFMSEIALHAEKANHHPEWFNVYGTVNIWLTTHQFDGISQRDFDLVDIVDTVAARSL